MVPTEMEKLEKWLIAENIPYERDTKVLNQIIVFDSWKKDEVIFDVVCYPGTYGYESGLLEAMGKIVDEVADEDGVAGYLTASDVIARYKNFLEYGAPVL